MRTVLWKRVGSWRTGGGVFVGVPRRRSWFRLGFYLGLILIALIALGGI